MSSPDPRSDDAADHLSEIRTELTDGRDLSLAAQLVSDVLARRVRRVVRSLDALEELLDELDGEELADHVETLRRRTTTFREETEVLAERLARSTDAFEDDVSAAAALVDEAFAEDLDEND